MGVTEDAVCRLYGEEVESLGDICQRCPALLVQRHHSDFGHAMDELVRLPRAALAFLMNILRRLR